MILSDKDIKSTLRKDAQSPSAGAKKASSAAAQATGIIEVRDLHVAYGSFTAVRDISFSVREGEIFGLLGPNGAGKTTTLSVIEGLRKPSGGSVFVGGHNAATEATQVKQQLGIQLQSTALLPNLSSVELIRLYAALYNVFLSPDEIHLLLERFNLADKARSRVSQLSGGQQQRLALAVALANRPHIVILDEPTTGLDPQNRHAVWDLITAIRADGHTVILTTHFMEEAELLCDHIAIIDHGQVIAAGKPRELIQNTLGAITVLIVEGDAPRERVEALPGVQNVTQTGNRLEVRTTSPSATRDALQTLAKSSGVSFTAPNERPANLEDVFLNLTGRVLRS